MNSASFPARARIRPRASSSSALRILRLFLTCVFASTALAELPTTTPLHVSPAGQIFVGQAVTFVEYAFDPEDKALIYQFSFGDGAVTIPWTDSFAQHSYAAAGIYTVTCTVSDLTGSKYVTTNIVVRNPVLGTGLDADGDGFSDDLELAFGTSQVSASDTPFGTAPAKDTDLQPFDVVTTAVRLDFRQGKTSSDTISVSGTMYIPGNVHPENVLVQVNFGGIARTFVLNAKGTATLDDKSSFALIGRFDKENLRMINRLFRFRMTLSPAAYASSLVDEGLTNTTGLKPVAVPVSILFNDQFAYVGSSTMTYRGRRNAVSTAN